MIFDSILQLFCEYVPLNFDTVFGMIFGMHFSRFVCDVVPIVVPNWSPINPHFAIKNSVVVQGALSEVHWLLWAPFWLLLAPFWFAFGPLLDHRLATFRLNFRRMLVASRLNIPSTLVVSPS